MDLATVCQHFILHMECVSFMYLRKICPKCDTVVHVKRVACGCNSVSYQSVHLIHATFQSNCAEGLLHFSAFHFLSNGRSLYTTVDAK